MVDFGMRTWSIYALDDPRTGRTRYVGWAYDVRKRLEAHIRRARREKTHKANWLNFLAATGLKPALRILESGTESWADAERRWIARYRSDGADLTNATVGGEGITGMRFSAETRAKMSAAKRGRKLSPEHVEKVATANRGKRRAPDVIEKIQAKRKGFRHSEATVARIADKLRGRPLSPERVAALRGRKLGPCSEETKAKIRAKHVGKRLTPEHRKKLSDAHRGKRLSEKHKAKLARSKGWKHTPEAIAKITAARRARAAGASKPRSGQLPLF